MMWRGLVVVQVEVFVLTFACMEMLRRIMRNQSGELVCGLKFEPVTYQI
jgi:hypothetical protein